MSRQTERDSSKAIPIAKHAMRRFKEFFIAMTNVDVNGRIIVNAGNGKRGDGDGDGDGQASVRFLMLAASSVFAPIVSSARSVVLAGGTMRPHWYYSQQVFNTKAQNMSTQHHHHHHPHRALVKFFTFGHVVPPENVCALTLGVGPTGSRFRFTFAARSNLKLLCELGSTLVNLARLCPV